MEVILIAHDIRSIHNIGSLARSADGFGISTLYCTGFTPYIVADIDDRPPHIRKKVAVAIHKTALGAEKTVDIIHHPDLIKLVKNLKSQGYIVAALEQSRTSVPLNTSMNSKKIALILGTETTGIDNEILSICDEVLEIPMLGSKESLNVSVAGAIAMYELKRSELY